MLTLKPIAPATLRRLLESAGYTLIAGDEYNWLFAKESCQLPVLLPHHVPFVVPRQVWQVPDETVRMLEDMRTSDRDFHALLVSVRDCIFPPYEDPFH